MFKTAATKIAHNSTLPSLGGNRDLRPLQDLILAEKAVITSLQKLGTEFDRAAEALSAWGVGEGDDLADILSGSSTILRLFSASLTQYAARGHSMRDILKTVRTREEELDELRKQRKSVGSKAEASDKKLSRMSTENKNYAMQTEQLDRLTGEIRQLDAEILTQEAAISDFKRKSAREWMSLKFGGLVECTEKGTIVGELGKLIISEIPDNITQPGRPRAYYGGQAKTGALVNEARRCVSDITYNPLPNNLRTPSLSIQDQSMPQGGALSPLESIGGAGPSEWSVGGAEGEISPLFPVPSSNPPSAQGLGYSLDPSGLSTQSNFTSDSTTGTVGGGYSREGSQSQPYSVDDIGLPTQTPRRNIAGTGQWGENGGGKFATFPVKGAGAGRGRGMLRDEGGPLQNAVASKDSSFELEVTQAWKEKHDSLSGPSHQVKPSVSSDASFGSGPLGAPVLANPWGDSTRQRKDSNGSTHLAYMSGSDDEPRGRGNRSARFGENSDAEEGDRMEGMGVDNQGRPPLATQSSGPSSRRVAPPIVTSEEDERMRNAAAAREVSRELALSSPPTSPTTTSSHAASYPPPSPLAPPVPPFARREVSPNPSGPEASFGRVDPYGSRTSLDIAPPSATSTGFPRINSLPGTPILTLPNPYQPRSVSASHSPLGIRDNSMAASSTPSLNSPVGPPGTRTISAAAFKRNQSGRQGSLSDLSPLVGMDMPVPSGDTSPLALRKKHTPNSSVSTSTSDDRTLRGSDFSGSGVSAGNSHTQPRPLPEPKGTVVVDYDQFDYISAYVNSADTEDGAGQNGLR